MKTVQSFGKYGMAAVAALCLASIPVRASQLGDIVSYSFTPLTGSANVFTDNDVNVTLCTFCVWTAGLVPWDLYITDGSGNVVDHLYGPNNEDNDFDFSTGAPGRGDATIGAPCPDPSLCQVEDPSGTTDVTALFNSLDVSGIGGIDGMTVQAIPEPAPLTLWGVGLLGLLGARRRKGRQALP